MELHRIRTLKLATPFRPFFVLLKDGRRLLVQRSSNVAIARDGSKLGITDKTGVRFLRLDDIRDLDVLAPSLSRNDDGDDE